MSAVSDGDLKVMREALTRVAEGVRDFSNATLAASKKHEISETALGVISHSLFDIVIPLQTLISGAVMGYDTSFAEGEVDPVPDSALPDINAIFTEGPDN